MQCTVPLWLNVGGVYYATSRSTLESAGGFLKKLSEVTESEVFIDRNGIAFSFVLDYLRSGVILTNDPVMVRLLQVEADYYGLSSMETALRNVITNEDCFKEICASLKQIAKK